MLSEDQRERLKPNSITLIVINSAMVMGAAFFAIIVSVLIVDWNNLSTNNSMLVWLGLVCGVGTILLSFIVPKIIASSNLNELKNVYAKTDTKKIDLGDNQKLSAGLFAKYQTNHIIRLALIEGGVFLNLMLFMLERNIINLVVAAVGLLLMLLLIPIPNRVFGWMDKQITEIIANASGR